MNLKINMKTNHLLAIVGYSGWCGLGFIRGKNSYLYSHKKYESDKPYLYSDLVIEGLIGVFFYANPIFLPLNLYKEIYRLEINIRNLEKEKKSLFYNSLI
jgi:hypothetical protein